MAREYHLRPGDLQHMTPRQLLDTAKDLERRVKASKRRTHG